MTTNPPMQVINPILYDDAVINLLGKATSWFAETPLGKRVASVHKELVVRPRRQLTRKKQSFFGAIGLFRVQADEPNEIGMTVMASNHGNISMGDTSIGNHGDTVISNHGNSVSKQIEGVDNKKEESQRIRNTSIQEPTPDGNHITDAGNHGNNDTEINHGEIESRAAAANRRRTRRRRNMESATEIEPAAADNNNNRGTNLSNLEEQC
eukprot:sb/3470292/